MKISFAFSPCPNDTFMFGPIYNKSIDLKGLDFEIIMEDVEYLNKAAKKQQFHITKLSYNAFAHLTPYFQLLNAGSALGRGCGPLLITRKDKFLSDVQSLSIAVPGFNTTAFFLLKHAYPQLNITNIHEVLFSDIENHVLEGHFDAGVIIHENRFTFQQKGLVQITDLGAHWEESTGYPIPLGGIAVQRSLDADLKIIIDEIVSESVAYAFANPRSGLDFIKCNAQEMEEEVMYNHINLYVNEFSKRLGDEGRAAIRYLCNQAGKISEVEVHQDIFLTD